MAEPTSVEMAKMSLDYASQAAQALMTLAVGVLAFSITFAKDFVKDNTYPLHFKIGLVAFCSIYMLRFNRNGRVSSASK